MTNNIFYNNGYGITIYSGSASADYNCFYGNTKNTHTFDGSSITSTDEVLSGPLFIDPDMETDPQTLSRWDFNQINFRLQNGSPCINAGNPDPVYNDPNGTRNDIGAYGGLDGEKTYVNIAPDLAIIGNRSVAEGGTLSFTVNATDTDGDALTYSAYTLPKGAIFSGQTFTWVLDYTQAGSYSVTFSVTDGMAIDSETVEIMVVNTNRMPSADAGSDQTVNTGDTVSFDGSSSSDPDGGGLSYSWDFGDGQTGNGVDVSHMYTRAGEYTVTLTVSDGELTDTDALTVVVQNVNNNPPPHAVVLTITYNSSGTTNPSPGSYEYDEGTAVTISANPINGYTFSGWSGDYTGTANPATITMDSDKTITANFSAILLSAPVPNLTSSATVTATSEYSSAYRVTNVIDGIIGAWDHGEWASKGEMTPWIKFTWDSPQLINKVILYDRSNPIDHIKDARMYLNKYGQRINSIHLGMFPYGGSAKEVVFDPVETDEITIVITDGTGQNIGLSEFMAYYDSNIPSVE